MLTTVGNIANLAANLWQNAPQSYSENEVDCYNLVGTCATPFDCGTVWEPAGDLSYYCTYNY